MPLPPDKIALARQFAAATPDAEQVLLGPDLATAAPRWLPRLAGMLVSLTASPGPSYAERSEAVAAAAAYRDLCAAALS